MNAAIRYLVFIFGMLLSISAYASALVESSNGDVRAGATAGAAIAIAKGQRVLPGATVVTGPKSQVVLRFDDGQAVLLNENSEFKVVDFAFVNADPTKDKSVFDLLKGAARFVSGLIGRRSSASMAVRVPQATIGIRGTDFMVALVNPAFMSVTVGSIGVSNAAGAAVFAAGSTVTVASAATLAVGISAAALPASVAASFSSMGSVAVSAAGAAGAGAGGGAGAGAGGGAGAGAGAGGAVGAGVGGITAGGVAVAGAVAAAAAAAAAGKTAESTTGTTGSTGTQ